MTTPRPPVFLLGILLAGVGAPAATISPAPHGVAALATGATRTIAPDFVGLNGNLTSLPGAWENAAFLSALRATGVTLLRYPAGTLANTWDWDVGGLDPEVAEADLIPWVRAMDRSRRPRHPYRVEDAATIHRATGAEFVFVLNLLTKDLDHSLRGLRRARDAGLPVRYVELGNELYFNLPLESRIFPSPEEYGRVSAQWIRAIKAEFPGVKCALAAGGRTGPARSTDWTARAVAQCPEADAIVVHIHTPTGLTGTERANATAGQEGTVDAASGIPRAERQRRELELLQTDAGWERFLIRSYAAAQAPRNYPRPPGGEIWCTEWNLRADRDAVRGTWANALFVSVFYHALLEQPAVTLSHYHNIVSPIFGAIFQSETELAHVETATVKSEPWALTAGGLATALVARAASGQSRATELRFEDARRLTGEALTLPAQFGWSFDGPRGPTAWLVNLAGEPAAVALGGTEPTGRRFEMWSASRITYFARRDSIAPERGLAGDTLVLPPHSITLLLPP